MEEQLVKYFSGNLTPSEIRKIEDWRSECDDNASVFLECHQAWKFSRNAEVNSGAALSAVMSRIEAIEGNGETISKSFGFKAYYKYAAIAVLAISLVFLGKSFTGVADQVEVAAGDNIEIIALPDGSIVTLSGHSSLTYNADFSGTIRNVSLNGKAFFDIQRDESKPFVVNTELSKIEVLGTSFLVNTAAANASTEVVVKSGRVAVSKKETSEVKKVELVAGEVGRLVPDAKVFMKSSIANYNYLAWKTKLIEFEDENLRSVLDVLSEVYGVKIEVSNEDIYNCQMSAKFDNQPMDSIFEILSRTFNLELTKSGKNEFYLSGAGCVLVQ
ncbi:MAG: FecR domain-containing protein [Reichenbachiella sp.]|uniref:FecR family protein n=1 Tax=Reichenbachiella sp. TaxID=2184521 RepID=UPI0032642272